MKKRLSRKMSIFQKISIMTALLLTLTSVPAAAFADTGTSAAAAGKPEVYTEATKSNSDSSGDGSRENPYNRFEDAVANVAEGGVIYILDAGAFINVLEETGHSPYLIDKSVTVCSAGSVRPTLNVRAAGIVLGGDVTFENITLSFANKYHSGLFANGHCLTLNNVARGGRLIHLFAGGLKSVSGQWLGAAPTDGGSIRISGKATEVGNIYAGGMNTGHNGNVAIDITGENGMSTGNVFACGASEPDVGLGNWFDITEPPDPEYNDIDFTVSGTVRCDLADAPVSMLSGLGAVEGTSVNFSTEYPNTNLALLGITNLTVQSGMLHPSMITSAVRSEGFGEISVSDGAALDVSGNTDPIKTKTFYGGGTLILGREESFTVTEELTGTTAFETSGGYNGRSGMAAIGRNYIIAPETSSGTFTFVPAYAQAGCFIKSETTAGQKLWSIESGTQTAPPLTKLECSSPKKSVRAADLNSGVVFDIVTEQEAEGFPTFRYQIKFNGVTQTIVEDPDSYSAAAESLNISVFMSPKLGSASDYKLCIESLDMTTAVQNGLYTITVFSPKADGGELSVTVDLTVSSNPGSTEEGDSGNTGGSTGGGSTGGSTGGGSGSGSGGSGGSGSSGGSSAAGDPSGSSDAINAPGTSASAIRKNASELFTDVAAGSWYEDAVSFAVSRDLFTGVGSGKFDPQGDMSRAMVMTVLAKIDGQSIDGAFPWYAKSLKWAVAAGISDGTNAEERITREQFAVMLYHYAGSPDPDSAKAIDLADFPDGDAISEWAKPAMQWAVSAGIMTGNNSKYLTPSAGATRAEAAVMLQHFVNLRTL